MDRDENDSGEAEMPLVTLNQQTIDILNRSLPPSLVNESPTTLSFKAFEGGNNYRESSKPPTLTDDSSVIESAYYRAQAERIKKPTYATMENKRASLPAYYHRTAVSTLIKEQQIVLISGETGCGESSFVTVYIHTCNIIIYFITCTNDSFALFVSN